MDPFEKARRQDTTEGLFAVAVIFLLFVVIGPIVAGVVAEISQGPVCVERGWCERAGR